MIYRISQPYSVDVGPGMKKIASAKNQSDPIKNKVPRIALASGYFKSQPFSLIQWLLNIWFLGLMGNFDFMS